MTTPSHRRVSSCRNSRAFGYHGVSSRSSSHRQSGIYGSSTQTGLAKGPASADAGIHRDDQIQVRDQGCGIGEIFQIIAEMQDVVPCPQQLPYPPNAQLAASSRRWHRYRRGVARTTAAGSIGYGRWYGQGGPTKRGRSGGDWTSRAALPNPRQPVHSAPK